MIGAATRRTREPDPAQTRDDEKDHQVSKPLFPVGHPFAGSLPVGVSPFEIADQLIAYRRQQFAGWTMKDDDDPDDDDDDDPDDDDDAIDPETIIKVGDKEIAVKDLQRIMRKEKTQGKRSGARETLKELGFDTLEAAKSALKVKKKAPKADDDDPDDDEASKDRQSAAADRVAAKAAKREAQLIRALSKAGADEDDLDDALAILDRELDAEYDDDDLNDAVEELKGRRPGLFGDDDEDDDEKDKSKTPARGRIPAGRPGKKKVQAKSAWARGEEIAKRRHGITD